MTAVPIEPTPEEIRQIQNGWTTLQERQRRTGAAQKQNWQPPSIRMGLSEPLAPEGPKTPRVGADVVQRLARVWATGGTDYMSRGHAGGGKPRLRHPHRTQAAGGAPRFAGPVWWSRQSRASGNVGH